MMRFTIILLISLLTVFSCKKNEQQEDIIVEKVIEKPQEGPEKMSNDESTGSAKWIKGGEYSYVITRTADADLPIVSNHDRQYHDNSINLVVRRADGSVFFEKKFTKENFAPVLPSEFKKNGVLLGMNFEKAVSNELFFVVSVGSPDETNEEFYYVRMSLDNMGRTRALEYTVVSSE